MWTITLLLIPQPHLLSFNHFLFFIVFSFCHFFYASPSPFSLRLGSVFCTFSNRSFFSGSRVLFTRPASTLFSKKNFKIGSNGNIHTFKIYFITVFSVFSNKRYPNRLLFNFSLFISSIK